MDNFRLEGRNCKSMGVLLIFSIPRKVFSVSRKVFSFPRNNKGRKYQRVQLERGQLPDRRHSVP